MERMDPIEEKIRAGATYRELLDAIAGDPRYQWTSKFWKSGCIIVKTTDGKPWQERDINKRVPRDIEHLGCSGYKSNGELSWVGWDLDVGHGSPAYPTFDAALADARRLREALGEADVRRSRSGGGIHVRHMIPPTSGLMGTDAPRIAKGVARILGIQCDRTPLGRQSFWMWSRWPEKAAYEEIHEQTQPVLDLAGVIVEALATTENSGDAAGHASTAAVEYDESASCPGNEALALASWQPGEFAGRSALGARNWADVRHFVNDYGLPVERAVQIVAERGGHPAPVAQWLRMLRYCKYPRGWKAGKEGGKMPPIACADFEIPAPAPAPAPAKSGESPRPTWPIGVLIPPVRKFCEEVAVATQTPVDLVAMSCLGVISGVLCRNVKIEWKEGMTESCNLFLVTALAPSERKSTVVGIVTRPLMECEAEAREAWVPVYAAWKSRKKLLEKRYDALVGEASKAIGGVLAAESLREAAVELEQHVRAEPFEPRMCCANVTNEKLTTLIAQNRTMTMVSAELGLLRNISGRYSANGQGDLDIYLHAYSGDTVIVDRMGRPSETVLDPLLAISSTTQIDTLLSLGRVPGSRSSGLLSRISYSVPESMVGDRAIDTSPVTPGVAAGWESVVRRLVAYPETRLHLHPDAQAALFAFARGLEARLKPDGDLAGIADWIGKLMIGTACRIAACLHACEAPGEPDVSAATMSRALALSTYFLTQAQSTFAAMAHGSGLATRIIAWLKRTGTMQFTARDAYYALGATAKDTAAALEGLLEQDVIGRRDARNWVVQVLPPDPQGVDAMPAFEPAPEPVLTATSARTEIEPSSYVTVTATGLEFTGTSAICTPPPPVSTAPEIIDPDLFDPYHVPQQPRPVYVAADGEDPHAL